MEKVQEVPLIEDAAPGAVLVLVKPLDLWGGTGTETDWWVGRRVPTGCEEVEQPCMMLNYGSCGVWVWWSPFGGSTFQHGMIEH